MAADARAGKQRARPRVRRGSGYFFFLGFLTSFFGLLSLAMYDPPLQLDYNRSARESEGRKAGSRQPGDQASGSAHARPASEPASGLAFWRGRLAPWAGRVGVYAPCAAPLGGR